MTGVLAGSPSPPPPLIRTAFIEAPCPVEVLAVLMVADSRGLIAEYHVILTQPARAASAAERSAAAVRSSASGPANP